MALKIYVKHTPSRTRKALRGLSYVILIGGLGMLFWTFYPMISFELYARLFLKRVTTSPLPEDSMVSSLEFAQSVYADTTSYSNNLSDFTQANIWFPTSNLPTAQNEVKLKHYTLSIPRLNLSNLSVEVGGNDLSTTLIHYLPTSLPGQYGNVAIFGHSTLPQLYNAKDYKTIFTYLSSLDKGDKIYINIGELEYQYEVTTSFIVKPSEISVLEQKKDDSYLTLITCTPPGTYWERLVVTAKLTQL